MPAIRPVILSGGSGTRLWPLSTPDVPKQFSAHIGERSLFRLTLERVEGLPGLRGALVVAGARHLSLVREEISSSGVGVETVLVEPEGRNTAPAVIAAALVAEPEDVLVILPSDHLISDVAEFRRQLARAVTLAGAGGIVTFGIVPTRPETGFGYIEMGDPVGAGFLVRRFKEKPVSREAIEMVGGGEHLWNSGMFVTGAGHLLGEAERHCPGIVEVVKSALPEVRGEIIELGQSFAGAESISVDYAIMEKTDRALVVPLDAGWDDVGSYRSLHAIGDHDEHGNHIDGDVTAHNVRGSYIKSTTRPVVVAGLEGMVVVETSDGVLVVPLDQAQDVRDLRQGISPD